MLKTVSVMSERAGLLSIDIRRPDLTGFVVRSIRGLGPVRADINVTGIASGDGGLFNSSRLTSRNIVFELGFYGIDIESLRQKSYLFFPPKKEITLLFETDTRSVSISGFVETNEPNIFAKDVTATISVICPDPFFYSTSAGGLQTTAFNGVTPLFEFPFSNESLTNKRLEFGSVMILSEQNIYYKGEIETGVVIDIHATGPASGFILYNTRTNEYLGLDDAYLASLTGASISNGDRITISTSIGAKRITLLRNGQTFNIIGALLRGSSWLTLAYGDNVFAYSAAAGSNNLQFVVTNPVLYGGI